MSDEGVNINEEYERSSDGCRHIMPEVTFSTFIMSLYSTAMAHMSEVPEPSSGEPCDNLLLAKHVIDTIAMLQTKTHACLDVEEQRLVEGLLYELRMTYVVKAK